MSAGQSKLQGLVLKVVSRRCRNNYKRNFAVVFHFNFERGSSMRMGMGVGGVGVGKLSFSSKIVTEVPTQGEIIP